MSEATTKYVVAVAALIFREGKVLAMRRAAKHEAGPGLWETLSGRVQLDEEPLAALKREIEEESGLSVAVEARPFSSYQAKRKGEPMIVIVYRARYLAGEVRRSQEHDDHAWLDPEEFAQRSTITKLVAAVREAART